MEPEEAPIEVPAKPVPEQKVEEPEPQPQAVKNPQPQESRFGELEGTTEEAEPLQVALAQIRHHLQKNLIYPSAAQEQNIEGRVLMCFLLSESGLPSQIQIKERSGQPLLDRAAIQTVRRLRLPMNLGRSVEVTIPIQFALK